MNLDRLHELIILNHGIFSFGQTAQESYERMVRLVNVAEDYLHQHSVIEKTITEDATIDLLFLAQLRKEIAKTRGEAVIAGIDVGPEARGFSSIPQAWDLARPGPLTPDHTIHVKPFPAIIRDDPAASISQFVSEYEAYFQRHAHPGLMKLDPAPRWAIWPDCGLIAFGRNTAEVRTIRDIALHTAKAIQWR